MHVVRLKLRLLTITTGASSVIFLRQTSHHILFSVSQIRVPGRRFVEKEQVTGTTAVKSSVQRNIRQQILEFMPHIDHCIDEFLPKKGGLKLVKCKDHLELYASQSGEILFFRHRDGPIYPSLRLLHKYPYILPWMQVDKGAIKFVLSGANIMCPGLTSPGGKMSKTDTETPVAIMAEGKQHALAVGLTKLPAEEILSKNKGIGIENIHYLNDGLWQMKPVR